jgi:hypothetical protein
MRAASGTNGLVSAVGPRPGFWCECLLTSPDAEHTVLVGSFDAYSSREAVRWIRIAVRMLVSVVDEDETEPIHEWLLFCKQPTAAALDRGESFTIALRHGHLRLTWSARPVRYLPLAHRADRVLPPCAGEWAQPTALRHALAASQNTPLSARR